MILFDVIKGRSRDLIPKFPSKFRLFSSSSISRRSLPRFRENSTKRNTIPAVILNNPVLSLLEKCKSLRQLKQIQAQMIVTSLILDGLASSRLIVFCAESECRDFDYCIKVLYNLRNPNVFSWNVAIRAASENENSTEVMVLYKKMLEHGGSRPDNYTFPSMLKLCAGLVMKDMGFEILVHVLKLGLDAEIYVHNAVIHMLVSCSELELARKVFDESPVRDLVSWNSLINGYVKGGKVKDALKVFQEMQGAGVEPDEVTMIGVVSSCAALEDLDLGRKFHQYIEESGVLMTVPLANVLMDMYLKCRDFEGAQRIFNSMGKKTDVSWTTMIVGYARAGYLDVARKLLEKMPEKDVVPWNALIGGYVHAKCGKEALALFHEMQASNIQPDAVTMVHCLSACSQLGALDVGIWIHHYIGKHNLFLNVAVGTALVDMYAKCGNINRALQVFHEMQTRNPLTWTVIIVGLAFHGNPRDAISYFSEMISVGIVPDEITFLAVLTACCHGGLVDEGRKYFAQISSKFNLSPGIKHYSCMVDLLGRAGLLEEAEALINSMPVQFHSDPVLWGALFFACRAHGNFSLGEKAGLKLLELDPHDSGTYVLLAHMYGDTNMWDKAGKIRKLMKERGVEKTPGCSSIEVNGIVYEFIVRDKSHPESEQIYNCLIQLTRQLEFSEFMLDIPLHSDDSLLSELETEKPICYQNYPTQDYSSM